MSNQEKIEIARRLNNRYNRNKMDADDLRKEWNEIESECKKVGINTDLILISPPVFERMAVSSKTIEQYFYEPENK